MQEQTGYQKTLGLSDGTMLVIGSMIGSGIFIVSADIARTVGNPLLLLLVWLITGLLTLTAALSYGEWSAMFPKAGGQYVYIREAYGKMPGFLYGWSFFAVIQTGTIAAVGVAFSKFAAYIFPALSEKNILVDLGFMTISVAQVVSIILIIFLSYINTRGINGAKWIQQIFTWTKIVSLFGLIIFGWIMAKDSNIWTTNWDIPSALRKMTMVNGTIEYTQVFGMAAIATFATAMVGSIFSSDAWNNVTFIAGEIKKPERNIGLSLFLGTLTVTVIYILANFMYLKVLPFEELAFAKDERVAVVAANAAFGTIGTTIIALMIMVSTFGCNNGLILSGARVYQSMALDGLFFKKTAELNKNHVPANALWVQCIWASALCLTGKYGDLLDYVIFVVLIFYILTIAGLFIMRKRHPDLPRPYKAFGYPILPAIYIVLATFICISLLIYKPLYTWPGLGIVLLGIPIYYLVNKKEKTQS